ncbi:MAG: FISUMP domain-containing protein [Bacteroidales bacterium]
MTKYLLLLICYFSLVLIPLSHAQTNLHGVVSYQNSSHTSLDGIIVYLSTIAGEKLDSTQTDQNGHYVFQEVPDGYYFVIPNITKAWGGGLVPDALRTAKHYTGLNILSGIPLSAADVDASGNVNAQDALLDLKRFVHLVNGFPAGDWFCKIDTVVINNNVPVTVNIECLCFGDVDGSYQPPACQPFPTPADAGPDSLDVMADSLVLSGNFPVIGTGHWRILSGMGGTISDSNFAQPVFWGIPGIWYTLQWVISTSCSTSADTVRIRFHLVMNQPCNGIPSLVYGGQTYTTVQIGNQCWMKENMNIGNMIQAGTISTNNGITEKYCYNNNPAHCTIYGGLYSWNELMQYSMANGAQGICPIGWHVPTFDEFSTLLMLLDSTLIFETSSSGCLWIYGGNTISQSLREQGNAHWLNSTCPGSNTSGFTALGCGAESGGFYGLNFDTRWWTSTHCYNGSPINQAYRIILTNNPGINFNCVYHTGFNYSVRCIKD